MTRLRLIAASLWHFRRTHLAVALAVAVATAVLTGALLVGDSMRGSLRHLTLERLGHIDSLVLTDRFFRAELAADLAALPRFEEHYDTALPAILIPSATAEHVLEGGARRTGNVTLIAADESFWDLASSESGTNGPRPAALPGVREVVLNQPLARALEAHVGDRIVLRLPRSQAIPADSALGRKNESSENLARLKVVAIVPAEGLGRFSLRPNQQEPLTAWLSLPFVQTALDEPAAANAIFLGTDTPDVAVPEDARRRLFAALQPTLADYGLHLAHHRLAFPEPATDGEQTIYDYFQLTSDRMLLEPAAVTAASAALPRHGGQPLLTWLANDITLVPCVSDPKYSEPPRGIPYSTVTALDWGPDFAPLLTTSGQPLAPLEPGEIVLNAWAAQDLGAQPGDCIALRYFAPETVHGQAEERTATFKLVAILALTEPAQPYSRRGDAIYDAPPTAANDPHFTPTVPGITDEDSIADWDPPFPFDMGRIRPADDTYWENHRTTPKAFVSLADGQRLWGSRFGDITAYRLPAATVRTPAGSAASAETLAHELEFQLASVKDRLGFAPLPLKRDGLAAATGTTPFAALFLGFSFFLIAAAVMLVAILFRLGIEQRAEQIGVMLSLGLTRRQVGWLLASEGALVAALGGLLGVAGGWAYAWLMLAGLRTWWLAAVVSPFLELYVTSTSLVTGLVAGWLISTLTILWTIRRTRRISLQRLVAGELTAPTLARRGGWLAYAIAAVLALAGIIAAASGTGLRGEAQAGAFMGGGALLLFAALLLVHKWFTAGARAAPHGSFSLLGLATRSAARHPTRSTLTVGLVAMASFLIVAISAFRLAPSSAGAGGFPLVAESDRPIFVDLNTPAGRADLLGDTAEDVLAGGTVLSFRVLPGDDASCRNLYQPQQPRLLGVPPQVIEHFRQPGATHFTWARPPEGGGFFPGDPTPVHAGAVPTDPVPVVLDNNTALYSLHLSGQLGEEFDITFPGGATITFQVVGLLSNSIFQGTLLVSEADLLAHFPEVEGYQYFLLDVPDDSLAEAETVLEDQFRDQGFLVQPTVFVLADLLAVQNTYLSTFQSLGALGLLLGTFGLAMVELRSVLERRGELALLQAAGFRRSRLALLVLAENSALLLLGLGIGTLCAVAAVAPHFALAGGIVAPLISLAAVLLVGLAAGLAAVRWVLRAPLLPALRGE